MPSIVAYRKIISPPTSVTLLLPDVESGQVQELATIDGTTYVYLDDGVVLPTQPDGIEPYVVTVAPALAAAIAAASPQVALVRSRVAADEPVTYPASDRAWMTGVASLLLSAEEQAAWSAYLARQPEA